MTTEQLNTTSILPGYVKVKLTYITQSTVSEAALTMKDTLAIQGPYCEEVWVLLPVGRVHSTLEAFQAPFRVLKDAKIVPQDAQLTKFTLISPLLDLHLLAYVIPDVRST